MILILIDLVDCYSTSFLFLLYLTMMHTKANSFYVKIFLAINLFLKQTL